MLLVDSENMQNTNLRVIDDIREKVSLFGALSESDIDFVLQHCRERTIPQGEVLFEQGQLPSDIFIILEGRVDLLVQNKYSECSSFKYTEGDCFGDSAVIGIQPQAGTAKAATPLKLLVLSRFDLLDILENNPKLFALLMMNIARESCRRLHHCYSSSQKHHTLTDLLHNNRSSIQREKSKKEHSLLG